MAKLFLDSTDTSYKVSNSNTEIFGANGDQAITIDGALSNIVLDANVERVAFTGATTDYTYKQVGNALEVYKNGALVTKVDLQDDTNGTQLTFANGTVDAKFAPSATGLGLTVGGQTVSTSAPAAVTIPAANIDVTTYPITAPTFAVASVAASATEGTNAIWTVTLANAPSTTTTVKYTLKNESGATNDDTADEVVTGTGVTHTQSVETATNSGIWEGTLTFAAGATTATISLPVNLDGATEIGEAMSLTLSNPTGGAIINEAGKAATVTFVDAPATTFTLTSTGTGVEVQEGNTITFTVTPNAAVNAATTLILNVKGEALGAVSATASAADFETTPSITFAQGETAAKTITLKIATDGVVEGREAYSAEIVDTLNYASRSNKVQGVVTDKLPTLSLSQNVSTVNEGSTVTYTVTSDENAPAGGITIPFTVAGTATSGSDYTALTASSITIPAGSKTGSVTLTTIADTTTDGADETVIVTLGEVANANVSATAKSVTTTITDSSKALATAEMTLTGATSVDEGSTVTYTVTLGSAATTALSIPYTLSGTATSGTDFTGSTGTISVAQGSKTGTLTLTTVADSTTEGAETVTVTLGTVSGFTPVTGQGAVTTTINDTSVAVAGSTFSLTTAIDNVVGTAGNDIILGDNTGTNDTATAGDQVNGGAGSDTFKFYIKASTAVDAVALPQLSNVEALQIIGGALTTTKQYDASSLAGVTSVTFDSAVAMTTGDSFTFKTAATQTLGLTNINVAAAGTGTLNVDGASKIVLDAVGTNATNSGTVTVDLKSAGTSLELESTSATASSSVTLANTGAALTTVTVSGSKGASITAPLDAIKTVTVSNTGGVSYNASGATIPATFTFTGGTGNDTLVLKAGALALITAGSQLNAGAGTDTIRTNETASLTTAQIAKINATQGFETLGFGTTGSGVDVSTLTSINKFAVNNTGTTTFTNSNNSSTYAISNAGVTNVSIANATGQNSVDVTLTNSTSAASAANKVLGTLGLTGATVVSLTSSNNGIAANTNEITTFTNTDNSNISVKGSADLKFALAAGTSVGSAVDASTFTGKLTVTGSTKADVIKGGTGNDTIQGAPASTVGQADVLTGGAGIDTFKFVATDTGTLATDFATLLTTSAGTTAVTKITDFVAGTDKIHLEIDNSVGTPVAGTSIALANPQTISTAADLTAVYAGITAISASTAGGALNGVVVTVTSGAAAGTYLYINDATAAVSNSADMLINITGISGTLTANDFAFA